MKILAALMLFIPIISFSQTYSRVVSDEVILSFIKWDLANVKHPSQDNKYVRKKIYYKPINWKDVGVYRYDKLSDTAIFEELFSELYYRDNYIFTKDDLLFLKEQYLNQVINPWIISFHEGKIKKRLKLDWNVLINPLIDRSAYTKYTFPILSNKNYYIYTVPLFSKDLNRVIIWKYYHGRSGVEQITFDYYIRTQNNSWQFVKSLSKSGTKQ